MVRIHLLAFAATAWTARAQTSGLCNPLKKDCPPNPAIGGNMTCDFTQGSCDGFYATESSGIMYDKESGAQFVIRNFSDAPTLISSAYIFFGLIEIEMKASPGQGVLTTLALQSDALDEIDVEVFGGRDDEAMSNYFAKGNMDEGNRDGVHELYNVTGSFHNYTIRWTSRSISWAVDGQEFRVEGRNPHDKGDTYPQTPALIRLGVWVGGRPEAPKETIEWAGGLTNMAESPFVAQVKRITITDFAGGDELPEYRATEYTYSTREGTWESIIIKQTDEKNEPTEFTNTTPGEDGTTTTSGDVLGTTMSTEEEDNNGRYDGQLSKGEVAAVVVGCVVGVILILAVIFIFWRRRARRLSMAQESAETQETKPDVEETISPVSELHGRHWEGWREGKDAPREVHGDEPPAELDGESKPGELNTEREPVELDSAQVIRGL